ncbi:MAG: hypothetical protein M3N47_10525 [Chloroflexota bacterium]|nr:hypothetical protein [Chloroflexota bacterium]
MNDEVRTIVTTDRQSAFDRVLGTVPFKAQTLNAIAPDPVPCEGDPSCGSNGRGRTIRSLMRNRREYEGNWHEKGLDPDGLGERPTDAAERGGHARWVRRCL